MFFDDSKISSGNFCVRWWIKRHYWKHAIFYGAAASVQYYCFLYFIFLALPSVMESSSYFRKGYALKRSKSSWFQLFTLRVFAASTVIVNYLFLLELLSSFGNGSPHVTWDETWCFTPNTGYNLDATLLSFCPLLWCLWLQSTNLSQVIYKWEICNLKKTTFCVFKGEVGHLGFLGEWNKWFAIYFDLQRSHKLRQEAFWHSSQDPVLHLHPFLSLVTLSLCYC